MNYLKTSLKEQPLIVYIESPAVDENFVWKYFQQFLKIYLCINNRLSSSHEWIVFLFCFLFETWYVSRKKGAWKVWLNIEV